MNTHQPSTTPGESKHAETACGAWVTINPDTPCIHYQDEIVYFCGHDCLQMFKEDPNNSCMSGRLLSGR
jgi:hypothetical protein